MTILKECISSFTGFCAGLVVSAAVFAFIAVIGIVPKLAHNSNTSRYIKIYEESIIVGGIIGSATLMFDYRLPFEVVGMTLIGLLYGIFVGCVAVCLAEVLNVLPVLARRTNLQNGLGMFMIAFAIGKLTGSLLYFFLPGFN